MLLDKTLKCMFLIKNLRVYNIGKLSAAFSLSGPLCATFPYLCISQQLLQGMHNTVQSAKRLAMIVACRSVNEERELFPIYGVKGTLGKRCCYGFVIVEVSPIF